MAETQCIRSTDSENREKNYCSIDMEVLSIEEFRVLGCGYYFCEQCLEAWSVQNFMVCLKCRVREERHVRDLVKPYQFEEKLFFEDPPGGEEKLEMEAMFHLQLIRRAGTIRLTVNSICLKFIHVKLQSY